MSHSLYVGAGGAFTFGRHSSQYMRYVGNSSNTTGHLLEIGSANLAKDFELRFGVTGAGQQFNINSSGQLNFKTLNTGMSWATNNTVRSQLTTSGDFGIGVVNATPSGKLHVHQAITGNPVAALTTQSPSGDINQYTVQHSFVTNNNSQLVMGTFKVPTSGMIFLESKVMGILIQGTTASGGDCAAYVLRATYFNSGAGFQPNLIGTIQQDYTAENDTNGAWNSTYTQGAASSNLVNLVVQGTANDNINWFATTTYSVVRNSVVPALT